MAVVYK